MSRRLPPALPRQDGTTECPDCWAHPGQDHDLSCPEVSPKRFAEYVAWTPEARPSRRRRLAYFALLALAAWVVVASPAALLIWSFR